MFDSKHWGRRAVHGAQNITALQRGGAHQLVVRLDVVARGGAERATFGVGAHEYGLCVSVAVRPHDNREVGVFSGRQTTT